MVGPQGMRWWGGIVVLIRGLPCPVPGRVVWGGPEGTTLVWGSRGWSPASTCVMSWVGHAGEGPGMVGRCTAEGNPLPLNRQVNR